ncbi:MAG: YraN family protein [Bacteroidales bacterium]|nr:YraN family protein [Bacteroidales bacterium]
MISNESLKTVSTYKKGRSGEDMACSFLESLGYRILTRNYVYKKKEVDIVARDKNEIVFVEVKQRATDRFGQPYEAVNRKKQQSIIMVADNYISRYAIDLEARFDIISITQHPTLPPKIEHIKNAFIPSVI